MTAPLKPNESPDGLAGQSLGAAPGSAADVAKELARIRSAVNPSRRGILICGQTMGQMLQLGWHKDQLDALEILFWSVRDADGQVRLPNDKISDGDEPPQTTDNNKNVNGSSPFAASNG